MNGPSVIVDFRDGVYIPYYCWPVTVQNETIMVKIDKVMLDRMPMEPRKRLIKREIVNAHHALLSKLINVE